MVFEKWGAAFMRVYLCIWIVGTVTGCAALDFLLGKPPETISREIDKDGDGKLSEAEIQNSRYDLDKDGSLSLVEMETAMAPHEATDWVLGTLAAFQVPMIGIATTALSSARKHKKNVHSMSTGLEELWTLKKDGITAKDIKTALHIAKERMGDAKALEQVVADTRIAAQTDPDFIKNVAILKNKLGLTKLTVK